MEPLAQQAPPKASALRYRDFVLFSGSRLVSIISSQMVSVAVGWRVYDLTGKAMDLGLVGLAQFLPFLAFSLVGGQVVDRVDRRFVLLCTYLSQILGAALLGILSMPGVGSLRGVYGVLMLLGATRAFSAPAGTALVPHLVPRELLGNAVSWASTIFQIATVLGPAVGGLIYRFSHSAVPVFFVAAGGMLMSFLLIFSMRVRTGAMERKAVSIEGLLAGFRFVWKNKLLLGCISLDLFAVLLGGAVALLPIYAKDILRTGPEGLGLLRSAPAVGAAVMAITLARFPLKRKAGPRLLIAVLVFGMATIVFGISHNFILSLVMLAVLGAADMVSVVVRSTLEQLATPHEMRGRVSAVNQTFIGASNELGSFESGVTAQWMGTIPSVVVGGLGTCAVVILWAIVFPMLRKVDRLEDVQLPAH
jgi:MFS family permease